MLGNITRVARLAADSAARAANQVADRYAYPRRRNTYPASMPVGRRSAGPAVPVAVLLVLALMWWLRQGTKANRPRPAAGTKPVQTWENEGGATRAAD